MRWAPGFSVMNSTNFLEPEAKPPIRRRGCSVFLLPLTTPASTRSAIEEVTISVCTPRSFLLMKAWATASGMPPMPSWMVEPSSTRLATYWPITLSVSESGAGSKVPMGLSSSTSQSMQSMGISVSPKTTGTLGLTKATTMPASSMAR